MTKHNKTPWTADPYGNYIKDAQRKNVCQFGGVIHNYLNRKANSQRIVACVNAMEGIQDPMSYLKQQSASIAKLQREKRELEELLETLNGIWKKGETIGPSSILAKAVDYHVSK